MAHTLDETDVLLLNELQTDADRPIVELARLAGLSPAATNTGTAPKMIAACVTLVRSTPRFCSTTIAP